MSETDSNLLNFKLINSNVCETNFNEKSFDVIYFDPMYPEDKASSARRSDLKKLILYLRLRVLLATQNQHSPIFEVSQDKVNC